MITAKQCLDRFGDPRANEAKHMVLWDVPGHLEIGTLPNKVYCNKLLVPKLTAAFRNIVAAEITDQILTWDGCFNIRPAKGARSTPSLHSWGMAIDINAAWNGFRKQPQMKPVLVQCFKDAGFDWGGDWSVKDGMHFQPKYF